MYFIIFLIMIARKLLVRAMHFKWKLLLELLKKIIKLRKYRLFLLIEFMDLVNWGPMKFIVIWSVFGICFGNYDK